MAQIKLSIAFVLAAAAIAPVVALPIGHGEHGAEFGHHFPHQPHRHHHHIEVPPLQDSSLDSIAGNPERRGYADGFEVRDLLTGQNNIFTSLENQDDQAHDFLPCRKCRPHKTPQRPESGPGPVVPHHKPVSSEVVAREYAEFDNMFEREPSEDVESGANTLPHVKKPLNHGHGSAIVPPKDQHHRPHEVLLPNGRDYTPYWKCIPHNEPPHRLHFGPGPVVINHEPVKSEVVTREYAEFDDMFGRESSKDVESSANTLPRVKKPFHGPVVHPHNGPAIVPPNLKGQDYSPYWPKFGRVVFHHEPVKSEVIAREYAEVDDMFEREPFEDNESRRKGHPYTPYWRKMWPTSA